jgi:hypothetical protein
MKVKLTEKTAKEIPLPEGKTDFVHFDTDVPGFGVRIRKGAKGESRNWHFQYSRNGEARIMTLG